MKSYIQYIYFPDERLKEYIRNDRNNEVWPRAKSFVENILDKQFAKEFDRQIEVINEYRNWLLNDAKLDVDNYLKSIKNIIVSKIAILNSKKEEGFDPANHGLDEERINLEKTSLERGKAILSTFINFEGQWPETVKITKENLNKAFELLNNWNNDRTIKIPEIDKLLREWEIDINKIKSDFYKIEEIKTYEIELITAKDEQLIFYWNVPKKLNSFMYIKEEVNNLVTDPRTGTRTNQPKIERKAIDIECDVKFNQIKHNFLFFYKGEFYEVNTWEQTEMGSIKVFAELSIFYNYYWHLIRSGANAILYQSPLIKKEVCECPEYNTATHFYNFNSTFSQRMDLFKLNKNPVLAPSCIKTKGIDIMVPVNVHHIEDSAIEADNIQEDDEWKSLKTWKDRSSKLWDGMYSGTVGTCYFLLSSRLKTSKIISKNPFTNDTCTHWQEWFYNKNGLPGQKGNLIEWKQIDPRDEPGKEPSGETINKILADWGLDKIENFHFLRYHIKATLYWRQKQIWQGNYWHLHQSFDLLEVVNPAGTSVNFFGNNRPLNRVTDSCITKVGGNKIATKFIELIIDTQLADSKGTQQRHVERSVSADVSSNWERRNPEGNITSAGTTKANNKVNSSGDSESRSSVKYSSSDIAKKVGSAFMKPDLYSVDHTISQYTAYQFLQRWVLSGQYPLMMTIEFNENLLSQYKNRRALKGVPGYEYTNDVEFSAILNTPGFLKCEIISNNTPHSDWFRQKIGAIGGVYLYDESPDEFYEIELPEPLYFVSKGGFNNDRFGVTQIGSNLTSATGTDNYVHLDNHAWLRKPPTSWVQECRSMDDFSLVGNDNMVTRIVEDMITRHGGFNRQYSNEIGGVWAFRAGTNGESKDFDIDYGKCYHAYIAGYDVSQSISFEPMEGHCKVKLIHTGPHFTFKFTGKVKVQNNSYKIEDPKEDIPLAGDPTNTLASRKNPLPVNTVNPMARFNVDPIAPGGDGQPMEVNSEMYDQMSNQEQMNKQRQRQLERSQEIQNVISQANAVVSSLKNQRSGHQEDDDDLSEQMEGSS